MGGAAVKRYLRLPTKKSQTGSSQKDIMTKRAERRRKLNVTMKGMVLLQLSYSDEALLLCGSR